MNYTEIKKLLNYDMNKQEQTHCYEIVKTVNKHKQGLSPSVECGNPVICSDYTEGRVFGSIKCVKKDFGFNYYLFRVGEKGTISCLDFQKRINSYSQAVPKDAFIHYLLKQVDNYNNEIYMYKGFVVKACLAENNKYRLEMLHDYGSGMGNDNVLHVIGYQEPIFVKIKCFCGREFFFFDGEIPDGEKYDAECPHCHVSLKRKKTISD
jgi:hypothetical protein